MFNRLLDDITFKELAAFCQKWPEGVRLDYKREAANTPKIVSSLANTMGGLWIIGVVTDKKTNLPLPFPEGVPGISLCPGIEEQIIQSCLQGIYPPILPHIKVLAIPDAPDKAVVVVKVSESVEAPHAIENSERVYVRTSSISDVIKLAEVERIEYLLARRKEPARKREELIKTAFDRARVEQPYIKVTVGPTYPYRPLLTADNLAEIETQLRQVPALQELPHLVRYFQSGMISYQRDTAQLEVNTHGQIFLIQHLPTMQTSTKDKIHAMSFLHIVLSIGRVLRAAEIVLRDTAINVYARVEIEPIHGHSITPPDEIDFKQGFVERHTSIQPKATAEIYAVRETLPQELPGHITALVRQLLWAFDLVDDIMMPWLGRILKANRLVR